MTVEVGKTFSDGVDRMVSKAGALAVGAFFAMRLVTTYAHDAFLSSLVAFALGLTQYGLLDLRRELSERGLDAAWAVAGGPLTEAESMDGGLSLPVALFLLLLTPFLAELVYVVSVRAIAGAHSPDLPLVGITDGLGWAFVKSFLAGVFSTVLVLFAGLFGVFPGVILAVLFLFVRQRIVLADDAVFESMSNSIGVFKANAVPMLLIALALFAIWWVGNFVVGAIPVGIVQNLGFAAVTVFFLSIVTSAFLQAHPEASL